MELQTAEQSQASNYESTISELQLKTDKLKQFQQEVHSVKEYSSDLQTFVMTKHIEIELEKEKESLKHATQTGRLERVELKCDLNVSVVFMFYC